MNPVLAFEYLFFAVFGQTTHGELKVETNQPQWTSVLFKLTFGVYMLVSVVVLINLLIAMMSDTYQRIQAQSDIEWKYGLSKLIRNMHRTTTAPSPLNLLTTWIVYFIKVCRQHARSKMGAKWLAKVKKGQVRPKDSVTLSVVHLSPLGSQLSFNSATRLESVVDWDSIRKKYLALSGNELHKQIEEHKIYRGTQSFHETYRSHVFPVRMSPVLAVELLFFAIFGQTTHEQFKVEKTQPEWTKVLFKLTFGIYMLVSVVVLINLLIAMMSDTYQRIQAQSDIEWKYGLSKLVRNMHRTSTAPSPLNLLTTWMAYLYKLCKKRAAKKQRPSLVRLMGLQRTDALSARSRMGAKWLSKVKKAQVAHKDSVALSVVHLSPLGSQLSFSNVVRIDNVVDWEAVRHKYRDLYGENIEKHVEESKESTDHESLPTVLESSLAGVPVAGSQTTLTSIP